MSFFGNRIPWTEVDGDGGGSHSSGGLRLSVDHSIWLCMYSHPQGVGGQVLHIIIIPFSLCCPKGNKHGNKISQHSFYSFSVLRLD